MLQTHRKNGTFNRLVKNYNQSVNFKYILKIILQYQIVSIYLTKISPPAPKKIGRLFSSHNVLRTVLKISEPTDNDKLSSA